MCSSFRGITEFQYTPPPRGVYHIGMCIWGRVQITHVASGPLPSRRNVRIGEMCNLRPSPIACQLHAAQARILACGGICSTRSRQCRWRARSTARTGPRTTCAYRPHSADGLWNSSIPHPPGVSTILGMCIWGRVQITHAPSGPLPSRRNVRIGEMCNLRPSPIACPLHAAQARILACGGICSTRARQCRWRARSTARTGPRTPCAYRPHSADGLASAPMSGAAAAACRAELDHFDFHQRHRFRYDSFRGPRPGFLPRGNGPF